MSMLEISAAGVAWMVLTVLACYAANYAVINWKNGEWGQAVLWCGMCAVLFMIIFGSIPLVWLATC